MQLFGRSEGCVQLTEAGWVLLKEGRQICEHVGNALRAARRTSRGEIGRLDVGFCAPGSSGLSRPPPWRQLAKGCREGDLELAPQTEEIHTWPTDGSFVVGLQKMRCDSQNPLRGGCKKCSSLTNSKTSVRTA